MDGRTRRRAIQRVNGLVTQQKKLPTTMITDYNYYNAFVMNLNHWYAQSTLRLNRARVKMQVRVG